MSTRISRDPFARAELWRDRVYYGGGCAWCGSSRTTPKGRRFLYRYSEQSDSGRKSTITGLFCSVSCMRAFNS